MATLSVENYVKAIYHISTASAEGLATTSELARRLGVAPASVTGMLRTLAESGLAVYQAYEGVRLTEAGRRLALCVVRRHRLVELFLVHTLGLSWDEVHEEAEHWEHVVSDRVLDRIDEVLHYPDRDPHGDPIPRPDGTLPDVPSVSLADCAVATEFTLERVLDQSPDFLRYLSQAGLEIGSRATVVENNTFAGAVIVRHGERQVTISRELASKLRVRCQ